MFKARKSVAWLYVGDSANPASVRKKSDETADRKRALNYHWLQRVS